MVRRGKGRELQLATLVGGFTAFEGMKALKGLTRPLEPLKAPDGPWRPFFNAEDLLEVALLKAFAGFGEGPEGRP